MKPLTLRKPVSIRIDMNDAYQYHDLLLAEVRANVRTALNWKQNNWGGKGRQGYADYLGWAKESAAKARRLARKLGIHFGKRAIAQLPQLQSVHEEAA